MINTKGLSLKYYDRHVLLDSSGFECPVLINEIGTSYDKNNLKRVFESDPLIKKIDLYITFFYFLIGCFLLFHLCLYLFGPDVRKNYYFIFYSLNLIFILLLV